MKYTSAALLGVATPCFGKEETIVGWPAAGEKPSRTALQPLTQVNFARRPIPAVPEHGGIRIAIASQKSQPRADHEQCGRGRP